MALDYNALLFAPLFDTLGVDGTLTVGGDPAVDLRMIDKTKGVEVEDHVGLMTVRPMALARVADLTDLGLAVSDLDGAIVSLNGANWTVKAAKPRPNPSGEAGGVVEMYLLEA